MEALVSEWLNLLLRWFHITVGIGWIGTSFFFIWLDLALHPQDRPETGVYGEAWLVHGGGFYRMTKYLVAPERLPATLHWFKWEAYLTWLSGLCLLALIYFIGARVYLIAPTADIAPAAAIALSLALLAVGWLAYDTLCTAMRGKSDLLLGGILFFAVAAIAFGLNRVFTGRGTYVMVGALLGTIMAANVFRVIIPNQKRIIAALLEGRPPDATLAQAGKQRSLHNNYITLPVLFIMLSGHYPATFGHPYNWLILAALALISVGVRHYLNLLDQGRNAFWILPAAAVATIALAVASAPRQGLFGSPDAAEGEPVGFAKVSEIVTTHCVACHSTRPTHPAFQIPPKGVVFITPEDIRRQSLAIYAQVVSANVMPLGNATEMTDEERALLGRWIVQGAKIN